MLAAQRKKEILRIINITGEIRVTALARELNVSIATIRRDLTELSQDGQIIRTFGGAVLEKPTRYENDVNQRIEWQTVEKTSIACEAAKLVHPGDTILLDAGSTNYYLAKEIVKKKDIIVVTNSVKIAEELVENESLTVILSGGVFRKKNYSLINPFADIIYGRIFVDTAFIGASGIEAAFGFTSSDVADAQLKEIFLKSCRKCVVLADHTKLGVRSVAKFADTNDVDFLITDSKGAEKEIEELRQAGLNVTKAL